MKNIYSFCKKGDNLKNEDVFGYCDNYAWVIDGATDVFERKILGIEHDVAWYVNKLTDELKKRCLQVYVVSSYTV